MRGGLTGRMAAASAVLALLVGLAFSLLIGAIGDLRGSAEESLRAERVTASANRLERLVIDMQTGVRGFVISGDERFLEPWNNAQAGIPAEIRRLNTLVRDPAQLARMQAIERAIRSYVDDYSSPLIDQARRNRDAAERTVVGGEGTRRVDGLRRQFTAFGKAEARIAATRRTRTDESATRATALGLGGLSGSVLLIVLYAAYLSRTVAAPVRRLAAAAETLSGGALSTRIPASGSAEVGELARAFNVMGAALEESHDELETQNAELEAQQAELESANVELEAQQSELEHALAELGYEKERIQTFYDFVTQLAPETRVEPLAELTLREIADVADAEVGAIYVADDGESAPRLLAVRGLDRERLTPELTTADGLAGRALAERRVVRASHGETGLRVPAFGEDIPVRHELHVPLEQGEHPLGVLTLARTADRPFTAVELAAIQLLAEQAAVGLANAISTGTARRLAGINQAVLDATPDGIRMVDLAGDPLLANSRFQQLLARFQIPEEGSREERLEVAARLTTDPEGFRAALGAAGDDPELEVDCEFQMIETDQIFRLHTVPVSDRLGSLIGRLYVVRDVTAEREADRLKSELLATVSHELRTPLASILGFSELMARRQVDGETRDHYVDIIHGEAQRLTTLINDFLDVQRIEEGGLTLDLRPVALDELLAEEVELYSAQSAEHELELRLEEGPLAVLAEPSRVSQVVGNLLSNAIKYSPAGGTVTVTAEPAGRFVRVSVADSGIGIPADQQRKLFTKFFRVDSSDTRAIGGTGLGLALTREIVEAHGGRIGFESVEGEGSTFWFELPAVESPSVNGDGRARVLVIEDDAAAASLLREYLHEAGLAAETAASGEAGLRLANEISPALICLDIGLAGQLDGWEVLHRLKTSPATATIPVLVCTARNGRDQAAALGASDFLAKPFSAEQLRETVARLLPERRGSVLVADDDPAVRTLVAAALGGNGIELREAADGIEALAEVQANQPDAIVLDLAMPEMDGFAVLERLQERPETRLIPVVVLTGRELSRVERDSLRQRAVGLLEKSRYSGAELKELIRTAIGC